MTRRITCLSLLAALFLCAAAESALSAPILEYGFEETGTTASSTGTDSTVLTLRNSGGSATDLHSAPGTGVTAGLGLGSSATDRAFDNSASSMGGSGGVANQGDNEAIDALTSFTATVWYNQSSPKANFPRLISHRSGSNGYEIELPTREDTNDDGRIVLDGDTNTLNRPSAGSYDDAQGTWLFMAFTYDGTQATNNAKFYRGFRNDAEALAVDGSYLSAVTEVANFSINQGAVNNETVGIHLGNRPDRARAFDGLLDNFRIFGASDASGALSLTDLNALRLGDVTAASSAVPEPASFALAALGFLSLGFFGWRNCRGSRAPIAKRETRIRPERNGVANAHTLATVALVTTLLSATCAYAAPLQVDIQATGATTQSGWQPWNFSTTSSSSAVSTTFAYADATDGTIDVSIDPLFSAQGRNYGLSNVTDPGNLTIPDVWADQYFWNNNVNGSGTLTLDDLKAGTYSFTSYHYANNLAASSNDDGTASVQVDTGGGFVDTGLDVTFISGINGYTPVTAAKLDTLATASFQFTVANDDDQIQILYGPLSNGDTFGPNGFELAAQSAAVPEPGSLVLTALGLLSLGFVGWRRRRR